jgi:hypothetical protein
LRLLLVLNPMGSDKKLPPASDGVQQGKPALIA